MSQKSVKRLRRLAEQSVNYGQADPLTKQQFKHLKKIYKETPKNARNKQFS